MRHIFFYFQLSVLIVNPAIAQVYFEDVASASGIEHFSSPNPFAGLMTGGAVWADLNNDGWEDLYITGSTVTDKLYLNNQDGTFIDVSVSSGISSVTTNYNTMGVAAGDLNRDGFVDLVVTTDLISRNLIFINNGNGTFTEFGNQLGIGADIAFSFGVALGDYDGDGWLDIYIANWVQNSLQQTAYPDRLYKNNGDGTFTDVTVSESVFVANGCGLSASFSDFDRDGDLDILVGNDFGYWTWTVGNTLFENDNGNLVEASENYAFDIDINAMSMAGGDIDEDQDLDYYITNINGNALMRNDGSSFVDIAESAGVKGEFNLIDTTGAQYVDAVCWGAVFFDYDNDTYQDLFVSNGKLASFLADTTAYFQNRLFKNESAAGSFEDVSEQAGMSSPLLSKGCASADYDHDGDVDMVIVTMDTIDGVSRTLLMENINGNQKNWLQLNLKGVVSNFDALGTMVSVHVDGRTFIREIDGGGSSYMSQNSKVVHFGLDTYQEVDSVTVVWPVSAPTTLYNVEVNQRIDVTELQNPLGVNERSRHIVSVFPNPAEDYFTLTTANTPIISFEVFNSSGILVHKEELENVSSHKVDISFLSSGVYSLGVTSNVTKIWKRLVIQ